MLVAAITWTRIAEAQVNTQVLERDPSKQGWSGSVTGSLTMKSGNVDLFDVGGAGDVQFLTLWSPESNQDVPWIRQRVYLRSDGRYTENADVKILSSAFSHARWTAMWHPRVGSEVFLQHQYNAFLRLTLRALAGTGARVVAVNRKQLLAAAGTGYMIEYERIDVAEGADDDPRTTAHRWSNYLTGRVELAGGKVLLQDTLYVQPRFGDVSDLRVLNDLEVVLPITSRVSFSVALVWLNDSEPPTGIEKSDMSYFQSVTVSL